MKQRKTTIFGVIIALLSYGIFCSYVPEAWRMIDIACVGALIGIPILLIAVLIKAYKYYSQKNKE